MWPFAPRAATRVLQWPALSGICLAQIYTGRPVHSIPHPGTPSPLPCGVITTPHRSFSLALYGGNGREEELFRIFSEAYIRQRVSPEIRSARTFAAAIGARAHRAERD